MKHDWRTEIILRTHEIYKTALRCHRLFLLLLLLLWRFGPFLAHRLPCCRGFKADKILLFEDISPKLNPRPGRPGCLCPTPRSKPFLLGGPTAPGKVPYLVSHHKNLLCTSLLIRCFITALLTCIRKLPFWMCRKLTVLTVAFLSLSRNISG